MYLVQAVLSARSRSHQGRSSTLSCLETARRDQGVFTCCAQRRLMDDVISEWMCLMDDGVSLRLKGPVKGYVMGKWVTE